MTASPELAPSVSARAAAALARTAALVLWSFVLLGLIHFAHGMVASSHLNMAVILGAITILGLWVLAGWVAGRLLAAAAALLGLLEAQLVAVTRLADGAERLAAALERGPWPAASPTAPISPPSVGDAAADPRTPALAEVRVALRQGAWAEAERLIASFHAAFPGDAARARLADELATAKQTTATSLRDRIDAARAANDPERIFELRGALAPLLDPEALRTLDRDLARWLMDLIQKRLRQGVMTVDVALLAARVADVFDTTPEGASIRAALPTLRRSAGLCARCGQPYNGIADACPACLATSAVPASVPHGIGGPAQSPEAIISEANAPKLE